MRSLAGISIVLCNGATNAGCRQNKKEVQGIQEVCSSGHRAALEDRLQIVDERGRGTPRCRECGHVDHLLWPSDEGGKKVFEEASRRTLQGEVCLLLNTEAQKKRSQKGEGMPNFIVAAAAWLVKPPPLRSAHAKQPGWLGRHSSRPLRAASAPKEPYVDLSPLDLTRRH